MARSGCSNGTGREEFDQQPDPIALMTRVAQAMELMAQTQADMTQTQAEILNRQQHVGHPRAGSISDFRRLSPPFFSGTEKPLDAEQWLIQTEGLLTAAMIPDRERVNVVKIQLLDNAQTWWQTEETRYLEPTWDDFRRAFLVRFFPRTARAQMARQFMNLTQGSLTVDEYAAEFSRLSRFVPQLVTTDEDRARKFEDGLRLELQRAVMSFHYPTYVEVLEAAREHEQLTLRFSGPQLASQQSFQRQVSSGSKRPVQQGAQHQDPAKRHVQRPMVTCSYCGKLGHSQRECRRANGQCLACGASDHQILSCPKRRPVSEQPVPAPTQLPVVAAPHPYLPHQQQAFKRAVPQQQPQQQQRGRPAQTGRAFTMTAEQAEADTDVVTDLVAGDLDPEESYFQKVLAQTEE